MAQRRRQSASVAAAAGPSSGREATTIDVPEVRLDDRYAPDADNGDARAGASLHPAAQHPLFATTSPVQSSFARAQSYQRRRKNATDPAGNVHANSGTDDYDNAKKSLASPTAKLTTLDRLEGWFGLQSSSSSSTNSHRPITNFSSSTDLRARSTANAASASQSKPKRDLLATNTNSSRLVLVHVVAPADSLEGLALRYNTDVRTLRRANGLWPGDSVQVRKEVYIPVDEDAAQDGTAGRVVHQASEEANGKLSLLLLNGQQHHLPATSTSSSHVARPHARSLSVTSASSSGATSQSQANSQAAVESTSASSARLSPPELRRVPVQSLSHFPPPGSNVNTAQSSTKGKGRRESEQEEAFGFGLGLKTYADGENLEPGESGVEDLLKLAERARLRGSSPTEATDNACSAQAKSSQALRLEREEEQSIAASSPAFSSRELEEEWRPNKWTLGQSGKKSHNGSVSHKTSYTNMSSFDHSQKPDDGSAQAPPPPKGGGAKSRVSQGWNDIPEPPLSKTAKGQVAHAYKPKRRYPRPGAGVEMPGSALMEDLAAGLPPNQGPASNWARPIGDSLPLPADDAHRRTASKTGASGQSSAGWGQILSDTVRGKMRLEDALGRGIEDIRAGLSATSMSQAGPPTDAAMRSRPQAVQQAAAQRPSAELARAALSDPVVRPPPRGHAGNYVADSAGKKDTSSNSKGSSSTLDADAAAAALRRGSGRSLHELEDLRVQHDQHDDHHYNNNTIQTPPTRQDVYPAAGHSTREANSDTSNRTTTTITTTTMGEDGGVVNRRNVQKVDWLG